MSGDDITLSEYIFNMCIFLVSFGIGSVLAMIILCIMCAIAFSPFIIAIYIFDKLQKLISKIYRERIIKECAEIYCEVIKLQKELNLVTYRENDFIRSMCNNSDRVCDLKEVKRYLMTARKNYAKSVSAKRQLEKKK